MLNFYDEGYEDIVIESNLISVINFLNKLKNKKKPKQFVILEYFPLKKPENYTPKEYELYNLTMEVENGIVVTGDKDDKIYEDDTRVLIGFCVSSIIYIGFQNNDHMTISFSDGYIQIYY